MLGAVTAVIGSTSVTPTATAAAANPIKHVVFIYLENHSFDNLFGPYCAQRPAGHCDGRTGTVTFANGTKHELYRATDMVANVCHSIECHANAVNGGAMNGWGRVFGCEKDKNYACLQQYDPSQIKLLATLADNGVLLDRFFTEPNPSSGAHLFLFTGEDTQGFTGGIPLFVPPGYQAKPGWGCDSNKKGDWVNPATGNASQQWFCNPNASGRPNGGAPGPTAVTGVPDFFTSILDPNGISWLNYGAGRTEENYKWNLPPYQAAALYRDGHKMVPQNRILDDAKTTALPQVSFVTPAGDSNSGLDTSQHNGDSMKVGNNFISSVIDAVKSGPNALNTAVLVTWDDCGCFYDHVPPPPSLGIRAPLLIWSPWAKQGYVDHVGGRLVSILAFIEKTFGLPSLTSLNPKARDGRVGNDLTKDFDFSMSLSDVRANLLRLQLPPLEALTTAELAELREHAHEDDGDDT
jgi:phospholipase C